MDELFNKLQHSDLAVLIGRQDQLFGAGAQLLHIAGLILVLAPVLLISLRLFGFGLVTQSVPDLVKATSRFIWIGLALLFVSGSVILLPIAAHYYANPIFWFKFGLLGAALVFHLTWFRSVTRRETTGPVLSRSTAILAVTFWVGVAYAGRFIGFY